MFLKPLLSLFIFSSLGLSALAENDQLLFPVEKSNVRVLPQRFEYNMIDANRFQVGNLLIQASEIGIRLTSGKSTQKFTFYWPLDLLDLSDGNGNIVVKDSSGKALWERSVQSNQVQIKRSSSGARLASAELSASDDKELFESIQRSAFFKFCAYKENSQTKIYFCSKDLYLLKRKARFNILTRDSQRPESFVEINGQAVDKQGFIYLNSSKDPLSLRALMLSGSTLELDTRMKDVNFLNIVLTDDEKNILVSAQNREVETEGSSESLETREVWTTKLEVERPSLFLKGAGNIPLKQEFLIEGPVRKESVKVDVIDPPLQNLANSEVNLELKPAAKLRLESGDKNTSLEQKADGVYSWTMKNLRRNDINRRYVKVIDTEKDQTFWGAYDIRRISGYEAAVYGFWPLRASAHLSYVAHPRFNFTARYDAQVDKTSDSDAFNSLDLEAHYRLNSGIHMVDPRWRVGGFFSSFAGKGTSMGLYGLDLQAQYKNWKYWGLQVPWTLVGIRAPLASTDSSYKVSGSFESQASLRLMPNLDRFHELGLKYRSYVFKKEVGEFKKQEASLFYGFGILF